MKSQFVTYGLSYALNRGSFLLILPFATRLFSLAELGLFELAQITAQLSLVFIGLNGGDVIVREGSADSQKGQKLFHSFMLLTIGLGGLTIGTALLAIDTLWLKYGLIIGSLEAVTSLYFFKFRSEGRHLGFLCLSLAKSIGLIACFALAWIYSLGLEMVLQGQVLLSATMTVGFFLPHFEKHFQRLSIKPTLPYALLLIPNVLSFWILNSSDKLMIQWLMSSAEVGKYHIVYSLGMAAMLINGALSLTIPPMVFQNRERFLQPSSRNRLTIALSFGLIVLFAVLCIGIVVDKNYIHGIAFYPSETFQLLPWIFSGLYTMSFFYFYYSFLLYHKKAKALMLISVFAAAVNVLLNGFTIPAMGLTGAALSTFASYILFLFMSAGLAQKKEPLLRPQWKELSLLVFGIASIFAIAWLAESSF